MFSAKDLIFSKKTGGYQISRSLRFRKSASANLTRTFSSPTSGTTWTWSGWIKRGALDATDQAIMSRYQDASNVSYFRWNDTNVLRFYDYSGGVLRTERSTNAVFRDPSAWYHVVVVYDSGNATADNRARIYVNGVEQTYASSTNPSPNQTSILNSSGAHQFGSYNSMNYCDGYMADVNFIDGQALTPSSFGETNGTTGVWQPKGYTGTYGTNGFYLKFTDVGSTTAGGANTGYGKDFAGTNNWTTYNFGTTSTATTYDSMWDSPTSYDDGTVNGVGNYCVLNPLKINGTAGTFSNANLNVVVAGDSSNSSTIAVSSGKWYFEATCTAATETGIMVGIVDPRYTQVNPANAGTYIGYCYLGTALKGSNGSYVSYGATYTTNDVIGVAFDLDGGTITFYKNNTSQGTAYTGISGTFTPVLGNSNSGSTKTYVINLGQRPFTYTPPSGFKALNTQNLPTPTIAAGNKYMDISLWTGDQNSRTITNSGAFQPDLIWTKSRSDAESHRLHDAVRGGNGTVLYELNSNTTEADGTDTLVSGFAANGFTIAAGANSPNITNRTYVAWQWKGGNGTTAIAVNAYGSTPSIASTVSANQSAGFSVVTFTAPASAGGFTVGHGLVVTPSFIITKIRSGTLYNWWTWHSALSNPAQSYLALNLTNAAATDPTLWNNTAPTSSVFSLYASNYPSTSQQAVAYCFAAVAGYSAFGSYTGNGSADGPFVFTGFRPRYILAKRTDTTSDWRIHDTSRATYNVDTVALMPNLSSVEDTGSNNIDVLSNGFKMRDGGAFNTSSGTYIYAAFAENPLKYSLAR